MKLQACVLHRQNSKKAMDKHVVGFVLLTEFVDIKKNKSQLQKVHRKNVNFNIFTTTW